MERVTFAALKSDDKDKIMDERNSLLDFFPAVFTDMLEYDGKIWFSASEFNGLFQMDPRTGEMNYLGRFPGDEEEWQYLHSAVKRFGSKLFFVSACSKDIRIYDMAENYFETCHFSFDSDNMQFFGAEVYDRYLFFWNGGSFDAIRFDMENRTFLRLKCAGGSKPQCLMWGGHCRVEDKLYIICYNYPVVVEIDMRNNSVHSYETGGVGGYSSICYAEDQFVLTGTENEAVILNKNLELVSKHQLDPRYFQGDVGGSYQDGDDIYYMFGESLNILKVQMKEKTAKQICYNENKQKDIYRRAGIFWKQIILLKQCAGTLWMADIKYARLHRLAGDEWVEFRQVLCGGKAQFIQDRTEAYFRYYMMNGEENRIATLTNFLQYKVFRKSDDQKAEGKNHYGAAIYKEMKDTIHDRKRGVN